MAARKAPAAHSGTEPAALAALLEDASVPWFWSLRDRLAGALAGGRFPHGLLIHGPPGSGQAALACWIAQLLLCPQRGKAPCGACGDCVLFRAGNHPDLVLVGLEEKASDVKIEQIRALSERLAMKPYRGGYQVAVIDPADRMNRHSFNALLKTLEEPSRNTVLLLTASRVDVLPATISSRCHRLRLPTPDPTEAQGWLERCEPRDDWEPLLRLAAGTPLAARELARSGAAEVAADMRKTLERANLPDPLAVAAAWARDRPRERMAWLETWLEEAIRGRAGASDAVNNNRRSGLPSAWQGLNIRAAFALLDVVREARIALDGPLNVQLLFEHVLVSLAEALAGRTPERLGNGW